jgi:RND family efflux transporter MFP subunit
MHTTRTLHVLTTTAGLAALVACSGETPPHVVSRAQAAEVTGTTVTLRDTTIEATLEASGVAEPIAQATLSTKLMGTVIAVLVREGDSVRAGQPLVRLDARDLVARREQVTSGIASAEAMYREAESQAGRIRALYADSAAPRAQLDAVEAGLARAEAGVRAARAGEAELAAVADYSIVRAPFSGVVTRRLVDPGAFAAPGAPLVTVEDHRRLRVTVTVPPVNARDLQRGQRLAGTIEDEAVVAVIEGVVPASGSLYTVNATVANQDGRYAPGGTATLRVPLGERTAIVIPARAVRHEGDLTGVTLVRPEGGTVIRWVRLGRPAGDGIEVVTGLRTGDVIRVPATGDRE